MPLIRNFWLWAYLLVYAALLFALVKVEHMEAAEPLVVLLVLGLGFSLQALLFTRGIKPLSVTVRAPSSETAFLIAWLIVIAAYFVFAKSAMDRLTATEPLRSLIGTVVKLLLFVVIPGAAVARWHGYKWYELMPSSFRGRDLRPAWWMSIAMLAFQAFFGSGLREIRDAHVSWMTAILISPLAFSWLAIDAGVVEEFFFRAMLQTRLAALLKSQVSAIFITAALFGLVHAPGLYLRTQGTGESLSHPSLLYAVGYSFVVVSVAGLFLGTLWARTRNFAVVVIVHAATDLLPNIVDFMRNFRML